VETIALLTGRGNNTLPDKNVLDILGNPVLHYPALAGKNASGISKWYCSSDDEKILSAAELEGYKRIVRPAKYALPTSQHIDCIIHALDEMEGNGVFPDILVVLLANNVTVKSKWITDCINHMKEKPHLTSVVPVYQDNDHHPLRAKGICSNGLLSPYINDVEGLVSTNRQDLPTCYFLAHNFWVLSVPFLRSGNEGQKPWSFMGDVIFPYLIEESIDIHEEQDLQTAKIWIEANYKE